MRSRGRYEAGAALLTAQRHRLLATVTGSAGSVRFDTDDEAPTQVTTQVR